jgi:hypothetical protein
VGYPDTARLGSERERIYRLYCHEGLMVRRLKRKRVARDRSANSLLSGPNQQ